MKQLFPLLLSVLSATSLSAQTFTATGGPVPDDGTTVEFPISIAGLPSSIDTLDFGLETVCLDATHTWISDFEISLVAPDGTAIMLITGVGGDTDNFTNTCLSSTATTSIMDGTPPYTGSFKPMGQLGLVNNGQDPNGIWHLRVRDTYPFADAGTIVGFSLTFSTTPATYFALHSSNLPIVIINTDGFGIPDEPKIPATMGIIDNGLGNVNLPTDPFNDFQGNIGIELRGNSSQFVMPKKSYGFEVWDNTGEDLDASLLGMPAESDWILSANYSDKSLLSNPLTYDLSQRMGHYAARWRHVELILNGDYRGIYVLMEKIKRDKHRVDIAKLDADDLAGDSLTGGYMVKIDWAAGNNTGGWTSAFPPVVAPNGQTIDLMYEYPAEPLPAQADYIHAYVDSFETALASMPLDDTLSGYRHFLDVRSAIDLYLLNELSRNVDGYRLSTFIHKNKNSKGGKLTFGPVWDYDLAWRNAEYCRGADVTGWAYEFGDDCPDDGKQVPFWWSSFLEDPAFVNSSRCRWEELRADAFNVQRVDAWVDSMGALLNEAQARNFFIWPILGHYVWPNPQPVPVNYAGELNELKNWMLARTNWLDAHLPGTCSHVSIAEESQERALAFPDPFTDGFNITLPASAKAPLFILTDAVGRNVSRRLTRNGEHRWRVDLSDGPAGVYMLHVSALDRSWSLPLMRSEE